MKFLNVRNCHEQHDQNPVLISRNTFLGDAETTQWQF